VCAGTTPEFTVVTDPEGYEDYEDLVSINFYSNTPGTQDVVAACGTSAATCTVTVVCVESLLPNKGEEIDDCDENPDTKTFVLRTASGNIVVTATPFPLMSEANLPLCWALTGGQGEGKISRTIDSSIKGTHTLTCICGTSSKTLTILVVDLKIEFTPSDFFAGRSLTRVGIGEIGALGIEADPFVNIQEASWSIISGDASVIDSIAETADFIAGGSDDSIEMEVLLTEDPFWGEKLQTVLEQKRPTSTIFVRYGLERGHIFNTASVAFKAYYYLAPLNVSFKWTEFREDSAPPINVSGIFQGVGFHEDGDWRMVLEGNIDTGSRVKGIDTPLVLRNPPFEEGGGFTWIIPARVRVSGAGNDGSVVDTKAHIVSTTSDGTTTLSKGNVSLTIEALAPTENADWFIKEE